MSEKQGIVFKIKRISKAEQDDLSLRSLEISQLRILARKRPDEFKRIYNEIFVDKPKSVAA